MTYAVILIDDIETVTEPGQTSLMPLGLKGTNHFVKTSPSHMVEMLCPHKYVFYLAGAEKSPQRSELAFEWTTVLELLLSSSNKHADGDTQKHRAY